MSRCTNARTEATTKALLASNAARKPDCTRGTRPRGNTSMLTATATAAPSATSSKRSTMIPGCGAEMLAKVTSNTVKPACCHIRGTLPTAHPCTPTITGNRTQGSQPRSPMARINTKPKTKPSSCPRMTCHAILPVPETSNRKTLNVPSTTQ